LNPLINPSANLLAPLILPIVGLLARGEHGGTADTLKNDPGCKVTVVELVEKTGAAVDYDDPDFPLVGAVYLKPPMGGASARVMCYGTAYTPAFLSTWEAGQFPSQEWFTFVAQAGAVVTGLSSPSVLAYVRNCQHEAISDKSRTGIIVKREIRVECVLGISTSVRIETPVPAELENEPRH
jgi:hypothetical protein